MFVDVPLWDSATGVAFFKRPFGQGAERSASRCLEVRRNEGRDFEAAGFPLVGKETLFTEEMTDARFHKRVARVHGEGNELAQLFNDRVEKVFPGHPEFNVRFSECWVFTVRDPRFKSGEAWILAEPRLEGQWSKWNNNGGKIATKGVSNGPSGLCLQVPQAFSHFTYSMTDGKELFCDSQGVWNPVDGFCLTDPARHIRKGDRKRTWGVPLLFAISDVGGCELCVRLMCPPLSSHQLFVNRDASVNIALCCAHSDVAPLARVIEATAASRELVLNTRVCSV
jgi:hypothetical protein